MNRYLKQVLQPNVPVPQSEPLPGTNQVANSAGGFAWAVDSWSRLRRFLILGSAGGSYYATERKLTLENAAAVEACIALDGVRTVREIVAVSDAGRAPKNDPAIFALAMVAAKGDEAARRAAFDALPLVCRIGTHLFQFADYVQAQRGWGRGLRRAVGAWYAGRTPRDLAYQMVKYRQREGWTHTDLLRLAHVKPENEAQNGVYRWVTHRDQAVWAQESTAPTDEALALIWAFERVQVETDLNRVVSLIEQYDLPREALPTDMLREPLIWRALLEKMPITAMIRNLGTMSKIGVLSLFSSAEQKVLDRLTDANALRRGRVHPIALLSALRVYARGKGMRGQGEWTPLPRVVDALDDAFYLAFGAVEPANVRMMLALDVSGSMGAGGVAGVPGLTPRDASVAMALVTANTEKRYSVISFQDKIVPLDVTAKMRLNDAVMRVSSLPFGRTDCAQPMLYALDKGIEVDTFVVYTDSETWAGAIHPVEALRRYREQTGIPARLVVVGMVSNGFSIADPNDNGMLDVVGFDTATPALISDFAKGAI